eukprot:6737916-Prymnesium_polylepis.2
MTNSTGSRQNLQGHGGTRPPRASSPHTLKNCLRMPTVEAPVAEELATAPAAGVLVAACRKRCRPRYVAAKVPLRYAAA